jgi:hypothetical protein
MEWRAYSRAMPREERPVISLDDGERNQLHATWSRSGKRLIVTVRSGKGHEAGQVELDSEQAEQLRAFLSETLPR